MNRFRELIAAWMNAYQGSRCGVYLSSLFISVPTDNTLVGSFANNAISF